MCGISGIYCFNGEKVKESEILTMMDVMKHRGPDDHGYYVHDNIALGFVRLSIIDLSQNGHQPMFSDERDYVIVFNGEIFNYKEIKDELLKDGIVFHTESDTEVLLKLYIKYGEDCLDRLNGMWSFVILNIKQNKIFASRDRFGIKPFYYYLDNDKFIFSSEIQPILKVLNRPLTPNNEIIYDFLIYNRTDHNRSTFFNEIVKLGHGESLSIENNKLFRRKWYNLETEVKRSIGFSSPIEFKELLANSIKLRLRSDVPIGVCLSGGLDSSAITSILLELNLVNNLSTFSAVYNFNQAGDETQFIEEFRNKVSDMNFINPTSKSLFEDLAKFISFHAEPIPGTAPYAQFKVMELASKKVKVTLDGQGADEIMGGYVDFYGYYLKELFLKLKILEFFKEVFWYYKTHKSLFVLKPFLFFMLPAYWKNKLRIKEHNYVLPSFIKGYERHSDLSRTYYKTAGFKDALLNHFEYKLEHLLKWEDINSMRFSVEARVPFLDHRLVEKTIATKSNLLINNGLTKQILRRGLSGMLPKKIQDRVDKIGFATPQDDWFREEPLKSFILEIIKSDKIAERKIIDPGKLLRMYNDHLSLKKNYAKEIWKCIHLELWFRQYIDKSNN